MIKVLLSGLNGELFCYHTCKSMQEAKDLVLEYNDMPNVNAKISEEPIWTKVD